jgi:hypothetical protein
LFGWSPGSQFQLGEPSPTSRPQAISSDDEMLLTVNANGQQKEVVLVSERTTQIPSDLQTNRVFAIEQFLLAYHPMHSVFYASNP